MKRSSPAAKTAKLRTAPPVLAPESASSEAAQAEAAPLDAAVFHRLLLAWYRVHARVLPWRGTSDPYRIWVSEIMLQQTRVAAVIEHYNEFLLRFPSLLALALAPEADVLAAWSGLGYYRRARMLHKAAQFIMLEREGRLPTSSTELRTLPGIGEYTAAAIASIAFSERIAVVDGNVERVLLRLTGRAHDPSAAGRTFLQMQARALLPPMATASQPAPASNAHRTSTSWSAADRLAMAVAADPHAQAGTDTVQSEAEPTSPSANLAGEHNQAMMELGATICLPRAPLCLQCPVHSLCMTRGEHVTPPRAPQLSRPAAYLLDIRKRGPVTEVLLERRPDDASLMPSMYQLPALPLDAAGDREPVLRVRHAITDTNYYVQVFAPRRSEPGRPAALSRAEAKALRAAVPALPKDLRWCRTTRLAGVPLTGLARKILQRLNVMDTPRLALLE